MKLTDQERRTFAASFLPKKNIPTTVGEFYAVFNHEIWRTCNSCGHQWDAKKDGYSICPKCISTDLRSGKYED